MAEDFEVGGPPPEESSNRTFLLAAGGIGLLLVLSMVCLGIYAFVLAPMQRANRTAQSTQIILDNTKTSLSLTQTVAAAHPSATKAPTKTATPTGTSTPTQVVVVASPTPLAVLGTTDPRTATAIVLATLQAGTPTATATALPATGFADEVGLPGLLLLGAVLIVVVFAARQMRMRSSG